MCDIADLCSSIATKHVGVVVVIIVVTVVGATVLRAQSCLALADGIHAGERYLCLWVCKCSFHFWMVAKRGSIAISDLVELLSLLCVVLVVVVVVNYVV